jgi:hypothetical protein
MHRLLDTGCFAGKQAPSARYWQAAPEPRISDLPPQPIRG